jgi:hypothetical protein
MIRLFQAGLLIFSSFLVMPAWGQYGGLIGGFAGGLANGMQRGMQLNMQRQYLETQQKQQIQEKEGVGEDPGETEWREQVLQSEIKQINSPKNMKRELARQMVETDLADNPEKLTKLSNHFAAYGVADQAARFAGMAQKAKRRAEIKTFQSLMLGNVDGSIEAAKLSGTPFANRPSKVSPNDPNDFAWKIQQAGGIETVVNVKTMFEVYSQTAQSEGVAVANNSKAADERQVTQGESKERKEFMDEQRAFMRNQDMRNGLQIMQMLGPQPGQGLHSGY